MTDKKNESFEVVNGVMIRSSKGGMMGIFSAASLLSDYKEKIDSLQDQLRWSLKNEEKYKKLAMDNQARYSGALETIETLEKQVAILKEAVEFVNNTAPALYKYNEVELRMVLKAREALKQIEEMG